MNDYEMREAQLFHAKLNAVDCQSLHDRKDARARFLESVTQPATEHTRSGPELIRERCSWLIDGSYGYGAMKAFERLSKRVNRRAWLFVTVAALEWQCPNKFAREVWKGLPLDVQEQINQGLDTLLSAID